MTDTPQGRRHPFTPVLGQTRYRDSDSADPEPNVEAGDYIEDDPVAWASWLATVRKYAPDYVRLAAYLGSEDGAAEVLAGSMLSFLADQHGLYLCRAKSEVIP